MEPTPYFGLHTPREAIAELLEEAKRRRGTEHYIKRMKAIERHLARCNFKGRPMLDEPMSMASIDAVLKEAWFAVKNAEDPLKTLIRDMAAQGNA